MTLRGTLSSTLRGTLKGTLGRPSGFRGLANQFPGGALGLSLRLLNNQFADLGIVGVRRDSDSDIAFVRVDKSFAQPLITLNSPLVGSSAIFGDFVSGTDGLVTDWIDQFNIGGNDATQATTTEQPKIVDAGSLVTVGGNPSLDFFSNSSLESATFADGSASSLFMVFNNQAADTTRKIFFSKSAFSSSGVIVNYRGDNAAGQYDFVNYDGAVRSLTYSDLTSPSFGLSTSIINGSGKEIFLNGSSEASDAEAFVGGTHTVRVGNAASGSGFNVSEAILYSTDQSANRVAIEANINDFHSIY